MPQPRSGECSCCLSKGFFESILSKPSWSKDSTTYNDMLRISLGLEFPGSCAEHLICTSCSIQVRQIYSFRNQVLSANCVMRKVFATRSVGVHTRRKTTKNVAVNTDVNLLLKLEETKVSKVDSEKEDTELEVHIENESDILHSDRNEFEINDESDKEELSDLDDNIPLNTIPQAKNPNSQTTCKEIPSKDNINEQGDYTEGDTEKLLKKKSVKRKKSDIRRDKKGFHCKQCQLNFDTHAERRRHCGNVHVSTCKVCGVKMLQKYFLKHRTVSHGLKCDQCPELFVSKAVRLRHMCEVHQKERVSCPHCDYKCNSQTALRRHLISHKPEKIHQCSFCDKKFPRRSTKIFHERIHTGDKRCLCKLCGERFVQKASLKYHMEKYHPGEV